MHQASSEQEGASTYDGSGDQIDQDAEFVGLRNNQCEEQLCKLTDARHGIQIGLPESPNAHDAEQQSHYDRGNSSIERHEIPEHDVDAAALGVRYFQCEMGAGSKKKKE